MKKEEKVKLIIQSLEKIYPHVSVPLDHNNTFTLLIAVLLSAQCTDKKVNEVSPSLFLLASTARDMDKLKEETIYSKIKQLGLARTKAKNIKNLSKILIKNYRGCVPNSYRDLEALPGVGHKTASVVISQGFGEPAFPVDTHIHRLAQRWGLSSGKNVKETEKDLKNIFPRKLWNKLHLQIIFYGREYCTARTCFGLTCHICKKLYPNRIKAIITIRA